jgi:hypothetical protein
VAYVRTVRTASGARAVQIVHSQYRGSRDIEHIGSAHTDADLEVLKAVARQRLAAGQGELDLRLAGSPANGGVVLPVTSSRMGHLLDPGQWIPDPRQSSRTRSFVGRHCVSGVVRRCGSRVGPWSHSMRKRA